MVAEKRVLEHALRYGVGAVDLDGVKAAVKDAGLLVKGERLTTREMLDLEAGMVKWAREGKGAVNAG
ncbi:unnamed protein product [Gemmata massiliana]|uniref:Uncharacterized protein n=1 Tax=Gemmata massiliana TaxID=1210884 RepID=A0A6P2CWY0_9BACT|nr:unnamed protein product [Gemmata massiliana]